MSDTHFWLSCKGCGWGPDYDTAVALKCSDCGGELIFQGNFNELKSDKKSLTAQYINNELQSPHFPSIHC